LVGHGYLMLSALEDMYRGLLGWMELVGLWAGMLYCLLFVLRWYGLSSALWPGINKNRGDKPRGSL
jgi:hypothetical protein